MNKTSVVFLITILILGIWVFWPSETEIKNYPSEGTNIIAFGDSLVAGEGAPQGEDFVTQLAQKIDWPIRNLGKNGDTTASALARVDDVVNRDPKVVLVLLGGNDYLRRVPKEETRENLSEIITRIQDAGAIVLLLGIQGGILRDNYKDVFEDLAEEHGTAYVPNVLEDIIGNPELMHDSIHPNEVGYGMIADRIVPVLRPLLN